MVTFGACRSGWFDASSFCSPHSHFLRRPPTALCHCGLGSHLLGAEHLPGVLSTRRLTPLLVSWRPVVSSCPSPFRRLCRSPTVSSASPQPPARPATSCCRWISTASCRSCFYPWTSACASPGACSPDALIRPECGPCSTCSCSSSGLEAAFSAACSWVSVRFGEAPASYCVW